jgi:hypothetical protein
MSLEDIYHDLKSKFSTFQIELYDSMIWFQYVNSEDTINFEIYDYTTIDASSELTKKSYKQDLTQIVKTESVEDIANYQIPCYVIETFISNRFDSAGFTNNELVNPVKMDYLYSELKKIIKNPTRDITIVSFGEKFKSPKSMEQGKISDSLPFKCEKTFDARHINSSKPKGAGLRDLRGTDEIIQKCIESGSGFEFVMGCIIKYVEEHDCKVIGIYCTAGHHRSCAVVELMKKHLYPKATIKHLHINR